MKLLIAILILAMILVAGCTSSNIPSNVIQQINPKVNPYESDCRNSVESQLDTIRRTSTVVINPRIVDLKTFNTPGESIKYLQDIWPSETYNLDSVSKEIKSFCDINTVAVVQTFFTNQGTGATANIITPMICDKYGNIGNYSICLSKNILNGAILPGYYCQNEIPSGWICSSLSPNETKITQQPSNQCPAEDDMKDLISNYAKTKEFVENDYHFTFWLNTTVQDYKFYCSQWQWNCPSNVAINCRKGSKTGENINYYYCDNIYGIFIGKNVIDSNGTIKEKVRKTLTNMTIDVHDSVISLNCDNMPYAEDYKIVSVGPV
jgi:hypothetical protein